MSTVIEFKNVCKDFKIVKHREGIKGSIRDLFSREYKTVHAVNNISMFISQGEIVGYLGPNGAGKSTTIKMMTGIMEPTSGQVIVNGNIPYKNRTRNAKEIGVVFGQRSQLWWSLPLVESFKILKEIYHISDNDYNEMLDLYKSLLNITDLLDKPVRQMSLGQRTLSDILAAFLHNPKVVFLDEPTIGLDVSIKSKIRSLIYNLNRKKNTTDILTTHDMGDVDALCQRIIVIDKGKILYDNDREKLKKLFGSYRTLKLLFNEEFYSDKLDELEKMLSDNFSSLTLIENDGWIDILINEVENNVIDIINYIQKNYKIKDMRLEEISTENVIKKIYEDGV